MEQIPNKEEINKRMNEAEANKEVAEKHSEDVNIYNSIETEETNKIEQEVKDSIIKESLRTKFIIILLVIAVAGIYGSLIFSTIYKENKLDLNKSSNDGNPQIKQIDSDYNDNITDSDLTNIPEGPEENIVVSEEEVDQKEDLPQGSNQAIELQEGINNVDSSLYESEIQELVMKLTFTFDDYLELRTPIVYNKELLDTKTKFEFAWISAIWSDKIKVELDEIALENGEEPYNVNYEEFKKFYKEMFQSDFNGEFPTRYNYHVSNGRLYGNLYSGWGIDPYELKINNIIKESNVYTINFDVYKVTDAISEKDPSHALKIVIEKKDDYFVYKSIKVVK